MNRSIFRYIFGLPLLLLVAILSGSCEDKSIEFDFHSLPEASGVVAKHSIGSVFIYALESGDKFAIGRDPGREFDFDELIERVGEIDKRLKRDHQIGCAPKFLFPKDFEADEFFEIVNAINSMVGHDGYLFLAANPRGTKPDEKLEFFNLNWFPFKVQYGDEKKVSAEKTVIRELKINPDHCIRNGEKIQSLDEIRERLSLFHEASELIGDDPIVKIWVAKSVSLQRFVDVIDEADGFPGRVSLIFNTDPASKE